MMLSIIIINFNTHTLLEACLRSLFENYKKEFLEQRYEIIVVDNASTIPLPPEVERKFPQARFIINRTNTGFSRANNQAIRKAGGNYILCLNPDTVVGNGVLPQMIDYMNKNKEAGAVTCKVLLNNGRLDDACHRGFPTPWRAMTHFLGLAKILSRSQFFNGYHLGYRDMDQIHEIDALAGAFMLVRKSAGEKVNWFDEDYFWYGEDLDFCYRLKQKGYKIIYFPGAAILHYKGAASGIKSHSSHLARIDAETQKKIKEARFDVMRIFYRKHYQKSYPGWLTACVLMGINLKKFLTNLYS